MTAQMIPSLQTGIFPSISTRSGNAAGVREAIAPAATNSDTVLRAGRTAAAFGTGKVAMGQGLHRERRPLGRNTRAFPAAVHSFAHTAHQSFRLTAGEGLRTLRPRDVKPPC